ncbi:MAG: efflux RND transporter permease subunit [Lentisphaerae bacterium]|nr:efflux RND transporter permease subunit [Lentisphaerota bacterium]
MRERFIAFFARRHLLTNAIFCIVILGGVFAWRHTGKEELPAVTFDFARVNVAYPGATAEDVEYFVTKPIEEKIRGLDGVHKITSSSSIGQSSISVELEQGLDDVDAVVTEIRNEVLDVDLPEEVIDDPTVRVFETAKKAILDIALIHTDYPILTIEGRHELQEYALALENQLLSLPEVNSVNHRNFLQEEIQVKVYPDRLRRYEIPFNAVIREIRDNHVRRPAGTLETEREPKVTLLSELNTPERLRELIIQGGFEGQVVRLGDIAEIGRGFEKNTTVSKVNGYECVMFSVVKNPSAGILDALEAVNDLVARFRAHNLDGTPVRLVLLDDESVDVRNRLNIIALNGSIGFGLILLSLLVFLNWRSGLWVALGIPFTFCFTMMAASLMGHTINGMTLAAVIIVMGMVVDDAIVVAENITRQMHEGMARLRAVVEGTSFVMLPIVASIVTTCVAFVPLYFFQARHGRLIEFIPPIIFLMLGASLFESIVILPGHMNMDVALPFRKRRPSSEPSRMGHWFNRVERAYGRRLEAALRYAWLILPLFLAVLVAAGVLAARSMKYEMFPNEETREVVIMGETAPGSTRYETARKVGEIEALAAPYVGREVVGFRTDIARGRRGGAVEENSFRMMVEIVPREERALSADAFIAALEAEIRKLEGFSELRFQKSRWGQSSGSPIEVLVQQNRDPVRHEVAARLAEAMRAMPGLKNVEIDEGLRVPEYRVRINGEMAKRLAISPADVASTFRAALEGTVLYEFSDGDQDIDVRLTTVDAAKTNIETVLSLPVENERNYLVPLRSVVDVEPRTSPNAISREDLKRTSLVYADLDMDHYRTPLEIAERLESAVFPELLSAYPTTRLSFAGEIRDTREATQDFRNAVLLVLVLIYLILVVLFESLWKPLIIMLAIPFGLVGVILAFHAHGKDVYGFYAVVGALGLAGVVVNDAIIMLVKLDSAFDPSRPRGEINAQVARLARTRLRAVALTTLTTVAGVLPTAYGWAGYDAMLAEMMLALTWGLLFATAITLVLVPCVYAVQQHAYYAWRRGAPGAEDA